MPGELAVDKVRASMGFESLSHEVVECFEMEWHSTALMLAPSSLPSESTGQSMTS